MAEARSRARTSATPAGTTGGGRTSSGMRCACSLARSARTATAPTTTPTTAARPVSSASTCLIVGPPWGPGRRSRGRSRGVRGLFTFGPAPVHATLRRCDHRPGRTRRPSGRCCAPAGDDEGCTMRDAYHEELEALTGQLVEMTRLVGSAINRATTALLDADLSLAESVIVADDAVDA